MDIGLGKLQYYGFRVQSLESPDIHSLSQIAVTRSKWYISELDVLEVHHSNKSWSTRVEMMELCYFVWHEHI